MREATVQYDIITKPESEVLAVPPNVEDYERTLVRTRQCVLGLLPAT